MQFPIQIEIRNLSFCEFYYCHHLLSLQPAAMARYSNSSTHPPICANRFNAHAAQCTVDSGIGCIGICRLSDVMLSTSILEELYNETGNGFSWKIRSIIRG